MSIKSSVPTSNPTSRELDSSNCSNCFEFGKPVSGSRLLESWNSAADLNGLRELPSDRLDNAFVIFGEAVHGPGIECQDADQLVIRD